MLRKLQNKKSMVKISFKKYLKLLGAPYFVPLHPSNVCIMELKLTTDRKDLLNRKRQSVMAKKGKYT